jgi:hypothetical protein
MRTANSIEGIEGTKVTFRSDGQYAECRYAGHEGIAVDRSTPELPGAINVYCECGLMHPTYSHYVIEGAEAVTPETAATSIHEYNATKWEQGEAAAVARVQANRLDRQIEELAAVIADQARHIALGTHAASRKSAVARLVENVATLEAWSAR